MATNTQAVCTNFKSQILTGLHNLNPAAQTIKAAIYLQGTGLGAGTTAYSASGEATGTGYTAGGIAVTNGVAPSASGTTAIWTPSANLVWNGLTISSPFDCILLYNASAGNSAICVLTFPAQTISAGTFTYTMPANTATTALLQVN